jgi:two-component system phosphate regulon sensor histidine kinase PhoR
MVNILIISILLLIGIGFIFISLIKRMFNQERLLQLKNNFINNMTHELKTPIATISLAVDSINNPLVKNNEPKLKEYINIIKQENKKINQHVEKVLQMALLEKGDIALEKKSFDLVEIINLSIKNNKLKTASVKACITFESNLEKAITIGDEFSLLNVFNNLIDNALKYSTENCKIDIRLKKENQFYVISITDNGIGIDKTELSSIFDKFYRVQGGNLHDVKGSGLGLSYVRSIIELHSGSIEVNSEINKGSTFTIKLTSNES